MKKCLNLTSNSDLALPKTLYEIFCLSKLHPFHISRPNPGPVARIFKGIQGSVTVTETTFVQILVQNLHL